VELGQDQTMELNFNQNQNQNLEKKILNIYLGFLGKPIELF
jgi:hypothetical protein